MNYETTLTGLLKPLVEDKTNLKVKLLPSLNDNEVIIHVYASKDDMAKLIGKKGVVANSVRTICYAIASREHKKVKLNFENYE